MNALPHNNNNNNSVLNQWTMNKLFQEELISYE